LGIGAIINNEENDMIKALILGLVIGVLAFVSFGHTAEIRFENCQPGTLVGGVKWEWGPAGKGVYMGATYVEIPDMELKDVGAVVVDLAAGDYAITHFRPQTHGVTAAGRKFLIPSAILDFIEIEVNENPTTYYFGCD